jgi:hypothetical protein
MAITLPRPLIRALAATAGATAVLAIASPAHATFIFDDSDELVGPPALSCDGGTAWSNPVTIGAGGVVTGGVKMMTGATDSVQVPGLTFAPGLAWVRQSIVWDGYTNRAAAPVQANEQVRYQFYKDGKLVATTNASTDLADGATSAWSVEGLDTVNLPEGADAVWVKHSSYFMTTDGTPNSLYVTGACFVAQPIAEKLTAAIDTACGVHAVTITNTADFTGKAVLTVNGTASTVDIPAAGSVTTKLTLTEDASNTVTVTVGDTTLLDQKVVVDCVAAAVTTTAAPPTTAATPTTVAPAAPAAVPVAVLGATQTNTAGTQPQLAFTGRHTGLEVLGGMTLLVGGAFLVQRSRRRLQQG